MADLMRTVSWGTIDVPFRRSVLPISCFHRPGPMTLVYLHGLGSTKQDFAEALDRDDLNGFGLLAFDFPGCGRSAHPAAPLEIEEVATIAIACLQTRGVVGDMVIIGHSMGGLTGLFLCEQLGRRVRGFVNVEGNLTPEDCFWSREIAANPDPSFYDTFADRLYESALPGFATVAPRFRSAVIPGAFFAYARSIVRHSDAGHLLRRLTRLACSRLFIYGERTPRPAYLEDLVRHGVDLAEISRSHHFPAYSNPAEYYGAIARFACPLLSSITSP